MKSIMTALALLGVLALHPAFAANEQGEFKDEVQL